MATTGSSGSQGSEGRRRGSSGNGRQARPAVADWSSSSRSIVEICGKYKNKCGYCKLGVNSSVSYGVLAARLTCADYQDLIDRGWRRSGTYVYKPIMHETCCPQYTIRLDTHNFKANKGQRQVLNRLHRYLKGGEGEVRPHEKGAAHSQLTKDAGRTKGIKG
ncbi:unnamed protein product, partial [Discosporangium mesarthrocarpum]